MDGDGKLAAAAGNENGSDCLKEPAKVEYVGKAKLDYTCYSGQDYYSDGEVEDELLKIVTELPSGMYDQVIGEKLDWPVLYHLSPLRQNILEWIPMDDNTKVLEVGSGCGAVTGALARKAGSVTCVELSRKRSMINAIRNRECDNLTIHVGNLKDIEPLLDRDYDFIFLIGVFEYGQSYMGSDTPFEDFLKLLMPHKGSSGRIVIAIENKYGLKYFAGCKEDHLDTFFSGIENYADGGGVRTFSQNGLKKIFAACDADEYHFYYPYPDYKFMTSLYSDDYLPRKGELCDNLRNFDSDRMVLFNEKNAFDGLVSDGLFPVFSNSYLAVIGGDFPVRYVKYSNDRAPEYSIRTQIVADGEDVVVRKHPMCEAAKDHVRGMEKAYKSLTEKYEGSGLEINKCCLIEEGSRVYAQFEFVDGIPLVEKLDSLVEKGDQDGFRACFKEYVEKISHAPGYPVSDFDMIFSNILIKDNKWNLIDYEWTFGKPIPPEELAFRAVNYYFREDKKRSRFSPGWVLQELGITQKRAEEIWEQEKDFQNLIRGKRTTLAQMRDLLGRRLMEPQRWIDRYGDHRDVNRVQVYEDTGEGCNETQSYFVRDAYRGEDRIELKLTFRDNVKILRIDPAMDSCMVKILEMTLNGERIPLEKRKVLLVNGRIVKPADKENTVYQPSIVFPTEDPNINISLERFRLQAENVLCTRMEIVRIPLQIASDMCGAVKKLI